MFIYFRVAICFQALLINHRKISTHCLQKRFLQPIFFIISLLLNQHMCWLDTIVHIPPEGSTAKDRHEQKKISWLCWVTGTFLPALALSSEIFPSPSHPFLQCTINIYGTFVLSCLCNTHLPPQCSTITHVFRLWTKYFVKLAFFQSQIILPRLQSYARLLKNKTYSRYLPLSKYG